LIVTHCVKSYFADKGFIPGLSAQQADLKKIGIHQMATLFITVIIKKIQ